MVSKILPDSLKRRHINPKIYTKVLVYLRRNAHVLLLQRRNNAANANAANYITNLTKISSMPFYHVLLQKGLINHGIIIPLSYLLSFSSKNVNKTMHDKFGN
jgi:hypothetical protein